MTIEMMLPASVADFLRVGQEQSVNGVDGRIVGIGPRLAGEARVCVRWETPDSPQADEMKAKLRDQTEGEFRNMSIGYAPQILK